MISETVEVFEKYKLNIEKGEVFNKTTMKDMILIISSLTTNVICNLSDCLTEYNESENEEDKEEYKDIFISSLCLLLNDSVNRELCFDRCSLSIDIDETSEFNDVESINYTIVYYNKSGKNGHISKDSVNVSDENSRQKVCLDIWNICVKAP